MKPKCQWTPVKEQLPPIDVEILVTVRNTETGDSYVWDGIRLRDGWTIATTNITQELYDGYTDEYEVTAWMHLPDPYEEE